MNRYVMFFIFITIVAVVYFSLHLFVYRSIVRQLTLSREWQTALKWFFWLSGSSFFILSALNPLIKLRWLNFYAGAWLGIIAISFFVFLIQYIPSLLMPSYAKHFAWVSLALIGIISIISMINGNQMPHYKRISINMDKLPQELSGFKIVMMADTHLESYTNPKRFAKIVDQINQAKPDLIVIVGDLIESNIMDQHSLRDSLKRLQAKHGKIAVIGNHDYYGGLKNFFELTREANIKVLHNDMTTIADDRLQVVGLDDDEGARSWRTDKKGGPDYDLAFRNADPNKPTILLYHRPLNFEKAVARGVGLQLSGHTHAGQVPPMDIVVQLYYKYPYGLYKEGKSYIYTTSGTDVWRTPMRFLSRNEVVEFTLVK